MEQNENLGWTVTTTTIHGPVNVGPQPNRVVNAVGRRLESVIRVVLRVDVMGTVQPSSFV